MGEKKKRKKKNQQKTKCGNGGTFCCTLLVLYKSSNLVDTVSKYPEEREKAEVGLCNVLMGCIIPQTTFCSSSWGEREKIVQGGKKKKNSRKIPKKRESSRPGSLCYQLLWGGKGMKTWVQECFGLGSRDAWCVYGFRQKRLMRH